MGRRLLMAGIFAALLWLDASAAGAFAVDMVARGPTASLTVSDTVTVDVYLDADGAITIFSVAVINSNPLSLLYDGPASAALPSHPQAPPGSSGAQPSYLLYACCRGEATYLVPLQTPYFLTFPAGLPGTEQVNINYVESNFGSTLATGNGLYVATLVFHVVAGFTSETLQLAFTSGNVLQQGTLVVPPSAIGLSVPILLTGTVPEPATALLIGLAVLGVAAAARRPA